jgi:5-methylcytosine-specific restriction endonuclease McrA
MCQAQGIVRAAVQVDHVHAVAHGGDDNAHDDSNRQGLCAACHEAKTRADLGQRQRIGCDVNGYPIGPHPWNLPG